MSKVKERTEAEWAEREKLLERIEGLTGPDNGLVFLETKTLRTIVQLLDVRWQAATMTDHHDDNFLHEEDWVELQNRLDKVGQ